MTRPAPDPRREAFRNLFRRYAVPGLGLDYPLRCTPGSAELEAHPDEDPKMRGNTNKVMFAGKVDAEGFARDVLKMADPQDGDQEAYYCPRGGHWHLRNKTKAQVRMERYAGP